MFNKKFLILSVVIFVSLFSGYLVCQNSQTVPFGRVEIQTDIDTYTPLMSSTVGIGLTPYAQKDFGNVKFYWRTNYGHFVSWGLSDFKVSLLGAETVNIGEKIYWSYDPALMDKEKPPVQITLSVEDAESGEVLAQTEFEIIWKDLHIAEVKK